MKKAYTKPVLIVERFTLSQTIAHNCGKNLDFSMATLANKKDCGWNIGGIEVFMDTTICDVYVEEIDGVCHNAPEGGYNVFNS